jgi:hypothetical protein
MLDVPEFKGSSAATHLLPTATSKTHASQVTRVVARVDAVLHCWRGKPPIAVADAGANRPQVSALEPLIVCGSVSPRR